MIKLTPPMGWNSWNTFGENINEKMIFETADVMAESGLRDKGYEYLVIDDCWSLRERDENGRLVPDPEKFPHGMKAVADYVHSKGLKFGMYSCAGNMTCAGYHGSYEHEFVDAETFASWEERKKEDPRIMEVMTLIAAGYHRSEFCAETIARKMAVSRTTLNRLFQKKIGRSPGQYLLEYRLQQSEKLLQMGMTVKQTALSCGFEDPFYYSRVFRKHYGMPPSDYRLQFAEIQ